MSDKKSPINLKILIISLLVILGLSGAYYFKYGLKIFLAEKSEKSENAKIIDTGKDLADQNKAVMESAANESQPEIKPIGEDDHFQGELNAPVGLIVYDDLTAPYSAEFEKTLDRIYSEYKDSIVFAYRHFFIESDAANMAAAIAAECSAEQGKFWEMRSVILATTTAGNFSAVTGASIAAELKLDKKKFSTCVEENKYKDKILDQISAAETFWVTGVPTFFLNGRIFVGAYPYDDFTRSDGTSERGLKNIVLDEIAKVQK
jgi:protein-disulfide isomerase